MQDDRQPCVYILAGRDLGTLHVGVTSNLIRRLARHRDNGLSGFTAQYNVKDWKIALIQSAKPDWHDLAPGLGLAPLPPGG
jgi:putative endonuclease